MLRIIFGFFLLLTTATVAYEHGDCASVETFAEYMFRYKILSANDNTIQVRESELANNLSDLERLWNDMKRQGILSPLRARVCYAHSYKVSPSRIMKDILVEKSDDLYKDTTSVQDYIERSIGELRQTLSVGYHTLSIAFEETQKREDFVEKVTLANEKVRVCGVTKDIEHRILERLGSYLALNGLAPKMTFFFGSRVMPRTEVLARDPSMDEILPIIGHGMAKNAVRVSGLTSISDLEVMVIFSAEKVLTFDALRAVGKGFKRYLVAGFREFPVSVKFVQIQKEDDLKDPFAFITACRQENPRYCKKQISHFQLAPVSRVTID